MSDFLLSPNLPLKYAMDLFFVVNWASSICSLRLYRWLVDDWAEIGLCNADGAISGWVVIRNQFVLGTTPNMFRPLPQVIMAHVQKRINKAGKCIRKNTALWTILRGGVRVKACHAAVCPEFALWSSGVMTVQASWLKRRVRNDLSHACRDKQPLSLNRFIVLNAFCRLPHCLLVTRLPVSYWATFSCQRHHKAPMFPTTPKSTQNAFFRVGAPFSILC